MQLPILRDGIVVIANEVFATPFSTQMLNISMLDDQWIWKNLDIHLNQALNFCALQTLRLKQKFGRKMIYIHRSSFCFRNFGKNSGSFTLRSSKELWPAWTSTLGPDIKYHLPVFDSASNCSRCLPIWKSAMQSRHASPNELHQLTISRNLSPATSSKIWLLKSSGHRAFPSCYLPHLIHWRWENQQWISGIPEVLHVLGINSLLPA